VNHERDYNNNRGIDRIGTCDGWSDSNRDNTVAAMEIKKEQ
jgi:hypothetical protein